MEITHCHWKLYISSHLRIKSINVNFTSAEVLLSDNSTIHINGQSETTGIRAFGFEDFCNKILEAAKAEPVETWDYTLFFMKTPNNFQLE